MSRRIEQIDKAHRLPLASMSEHWKGLDQEKRSGKHRSQEMQKIMSRARKMKNKRK